MRIGFFGTPEIAAKCLRYLRDLHEILFLVTGEDKKSGRSQRVHFNPAKAAALETGIPVLQPHSLKDGDAAAQINSFGADIYVVVAYGMMIPGSIFDHPPLKTVNLHPSLLPRYRGAAPIQWALINGESATGITVQLINEKLDAGDLVLQETVDIRPDMTAGELYGIAMERGGPLLDRALDLLRRKAVAPAPQDESAVNYCSKIDRDTAHIDWTREAYRVHNLVRGLNPKPVAWTVFRGKTVKIWKTAVCADPPESALTPGELARFGRKRLLAGTGDGAVEIQLIQPENRDVMESSSFINGYRIEPGDRFE